jgi:membrane protease YdiL (CAAX protease family)
MISAMPPNTPRAVWIIGRLALRRQINRWQSTRLGRRSKDREGRRSGTPTKSGRRSLFGAVLFFLMMFSGFVVSSSGIVGLSSAVQNISPAHDKYLVSSFTYARILQADKALREVKKISDPVQRGKFEGMWNRHLDQLFAFETGRGDFTEQEEKERLLQMHEVFSRSGASGFEPARQNFLTVSAAILPRQPRARSDFIRALSLLFALWLPMMVFLSLGINNRDLSQVEWSFEWLFTFPVCARALFVSKVFVYSFFDQIVWWLLLPFVVLVYITCGLGYAALPMAVAAVTYLAIPAACVATVAEVALRKFISLDRLKNAQALFTVLGSVCLLVFYVSMFSPSIARMLVNHAGSMRALAWNPFSLPLVIGVAEPGHWQRELCLTAMIAIDVAAIAIALLVSEWLTADGLVREGGPYQGSRESARGFVGGTNWFRGVSAQEILLLWRDRNLLVQVLIVPLLLPAYYLLIDPHLRSVLIGNFRRAAMVAFAVGAYSFVTGAIPILTRENRTLWLLLSFPRSIVSILLDKAMFWAAVGIIYGGSILLLLVYFSPHLHVISWGYVFLVFYGLALYALIASAIGILAADVFESEPRAQLKISMMYLYFILLAIYANIFYADSLWTAAAQLVLTTLLAFALWQKVRDAAPYLLDPTEYPPRSISLADGMIAALGFSVAQPLAAYALLQTSLSLTAQITIAYIIAGLTVAAAVLGTFWVQRLPHLWKELGLLPSDSDIATMPAVHGAVRGVLLGLAAALVALAYLYILDLFPQWQLWKQDAELSSFLKPGEQPLWICVLAIAAAPILEEFIFRGLVFQGLRRTAGPVIAVLGSAALFALVHPPIAVIPVFGLGIAAAISFDQSKFLLAPILTHAVYNSCMLFFSRL